MLRIISPDEFRSVDWRNGKGKTIELAINPGGSLKSFDWRLSIASVIEDGVFSEFDGYSRSLVLISGKGITLEHSEADTDKLTDRLSIARFDGGNKTIGTLHDGAIDDFNIMVSESKYQAQVTTYTQSSTVKFSGKGLSFCYALTSSLDVTCNGKKETLNPGHLARFEPSVQNEFQDSGCQIMGQDFIFIELVQEKNSGYLFKK